ncbi:MAG TPA: hypothetical protein PLO89_12430, partial [Spirochaetota bacterium]|nr:hypothetical protein [Spirochaetota bacterium]
MKKRVLLFFILFNIIFNFYSQDKDQTADEKLSWKEKSEVFKKKVLAKDLAYADFAQLKSMAMALGLEENDTAAGYRNALSKFYNLKLFEIKNKKGDIIVLERAGELKMFKVKEEDEENLHITGRAKLVINNKDEKSQNVSRTVEADDIYIDLKNKEITGIGNVYFKDDGLEFQGEQFYFNFNINRGVLFEGRTKILKSGESGLKDAYFLGERIVQSNK